ncbi:hypothetical protein IAT40_001567 [Kwoniella sp. CBS 6097]
MTDDTTADYAATIASGSGADITIEVIDESRGGSGIKVPRHLSAGQTQIDGQITMVADEDARSVQINHSRRRRSFGRVTLSTSHKEGTLGDIRYEATFHLYPDDNNASRSGQVDHDMEDALTGQFESMHMHDAATSSGQLPSQASGGDTAQSTGRAPGLMQLGGGGVDSEMTDAL